ncbi:MAG: LptA/OstA family protein [Pseudomonadota bacterium]
MADTNAQSSRTITPILIEADHFEVRFDEDIAIWRGNVSATQANYTFATSNLTIHLDQVNRHPDQAQSTNHSDERTAIADQFFLSAQKLTYDLGDSAITGSGDSELRRGQELIKADTITYWVEQRIAEAIPGHNGRVKTQFYPNPNKPIFPGRSDRPDVASQSISAPLQAAAGE